MSSKWETAQKWELDWHSNCCNSFHEEEKQLVYAEKMGLIRTPTPKTPYNFDLNGASVLDIGGGAYSLLLKCVNKGKCVVADPLMNKYPKWVLGRYENAGIITCGVRGEDLDEEESIVDFEIYDECWIYNVLEHCEDPEKVIKRAKFHGKIVRIFEWINTTTNIGHIHSLTEENLNKWLGGEGKTEMIKRGGAVGRAYFGIFKGDNYATSSS